MPNMRDPRPDERSAIENVLNQYKSKFQNGSDIPFRMYLNQIPQEGLDSMLPFIIRGEDGLKIHGVDKQFISGQNYVYQGTATLRQVLEVIGYEGVTEFCNPVKSLAWMH